MKNIILLSLTILINLNIFSQESLIEIENEKIYLDEFKNIFNKNNDDQVIDQAYLERLDALRNNVSKESTDKNADSILDMYNEGEE
jgi:amidophosphoribosyltransferase